MFDRKGILLEVGQDVVVSNPKKLDLHMHSFIGYITDILEDRGTVIVEDQCSDFFELDGNQLTVQEIVEA